MTVRSAGQRSSLSKCCARASKQLGGESSLAIIFLSERELKNVDKRRLIEQKVLRFFNRLRLKLSHLQQ